MIRNFIVTRTACLLVKIAGGLLLAATALGQGVADSAKAGLPILDDLAGRDPKEIIAETLEIEPVWSAHPVGFALLTHTERQFVAYYDAERRMTVASRAVGSKKWTFHKLPSPLGWDSHNYVTMAIDDNGYLHLTGNMHVRPLVYFRTARPFEAASLERVGVMVDSEREKRMTYPKFLRGPDGKLIFKYRLGSSGQGDDIYNIYDAERRTWRSLHSGPLLSGQGKVNGYFRTPAPGPDGLYHIVGVWRDTPDAATNHDLSYARSRGLLRWETGGGKPIPLPITVRNADIVDAVPARGGMINGNTALGFDSRNRPVIAYHKFDSEGNTQIYNARLEKGSWKIYQTSDWEGYRWNFGGGGSIPFEVRVKPVKPLGKGKLAQGYTYGRGSGTWVLDEKSLKPIGILPKKANTLPASLRETESDFPGMRKKMAGDLGSSGLEGIRYVLTWETLGPNRDRPRQEPLPPPSMLRVVQLVKARRSGGAGPTLRGIGTP